MTFNLEKLRTPQWIFFLYMLVACLLLMLFRFIFPGSAVPLLLFAREWRLLQGILLVFDLFPALAFSALVVPFGLVSFEADFPSFSQIFFKRLVTSVVISITSAGIYGAIFFLALPLAKNYEDSLRFRGELYHLAKEQAHASSRAGEWEEAAQFIGICDRIWPESPELAELRIRVNVSLNEKRSEESEERFLARAALARDYRGVETSALSGNKQPLNATQAITMGEDAFRERRFFDAHWLAVLGVRIAERGSPEAANAARLASEAWNQISSQAPNRREERLFYLYEMKLSGYQAMNSGDWIRAFYIFQEMLTLTPDDPDIVNFYAASERGTREYAFFIDEMELSLEEIMTGAVFSLPYHGGRSVLRFSHLSTSKDYAFGIDLELMQFDALYRPVASIRAPYAKLLPVTINNEPQVMVITHALSRHDQNTSWECEWLFGTKTMAGVILDVSFEDFLLLSHVRGGLPNMDIGGLFLASKRLGNAGYITQIFEAEILNRLGSSVFFLPMAILVIVVGWRYRAQAKPRYLFVLLLPVMPIVFHGFVFMYRAIFNTLGIWLVLTTDFSSALVLYIIILALSLFMSMIILASQHK